RMLDIDAIQASVTGIQRISPEVILDTYIVKSGIRRSAKLVGGTPEYFEVTNFELREGKMFSEANLQKGDPVCIIGRGVQTKFFSKENPIGKMIKSGNQWLEVIGVLEERVVSDQTTAKLGIMDFNMHVYIPIQIMFVRYKNRDMITAGGILAARSQNQSSSAAQGATNYHQLDKLVI